LVESKKITDFITLSSNSDQVNHKDYQKSIKLNKLNNYNIIMNINIEESEDLREFEMKNILNQDFLKSLELVIEIFKDKKKKILIHCLDDDNSIKINSYFTYILLRNIGLNDDDSIELLKKINFEYGFIIDSDIVLGIDNFFSNLN
jgi:hypothetical protein